MHLRALTRTVATTAVALSLALSVTACADGPGSEGADATSAVDAALADLDLDDAEGTEIVDALDRLPLAERPSDLIASVRPTSLELSVGEETASVPLPEDLFYVSVAPYAETTHDCFHHSLTTCLGELGAEEVEVRVVDEDGAVVLEEERTTFDNGFVGFWLPAGTTGSLTITHGERSGTIPLATGPDDPTCLTTLQLT